MENDTKAKNKKPIIIGIIVVVVIIAAILLLLPKGAQEDTTVKEAVKDYLLDENIGQANEVFINYRDSLEAVPAEELESLLVGNTFLEMDCEHQYWTLESYTQTEQKQVAYLQEKAYGSMRGYEDDSDKNWVDPIAIKDGYLVKEFRAKPKEGELLGDLENRNFQLRKVCDNVYISYRMNENNEIEAIDHVMIDYDKQITDRQNAEASLDVQTAIEDIIVNILGLELEEE